MIHIKTIMVPVDFSEPSKKAVNYALSMAMEFDARLVLAHIGAFDINACEAAKESLLQLIPPECRERLRYEIIVKAGDARQELIGIVEEKVVDLVVMGSHGRTHFKRFLLGSVTESMLRSLQVPILTVSHIDPEKEIHAPGPIPIRRILYATDLTEGTETGLEFSVALARGLNAHLTVAHVLQGGPFAGIERAANLPDYPAEARAEAEEGLSRTVALVSDGSVPISTILTDGVPAREINRIAGENNYDLIVINLQAKGRLERALLGATAEPLVRSASVPVLSIPLPPIYAARWSA